MASSSHRPRKKRKLLPSFPPNNNLGDKSPAFPLVAFLWSARWATSPWVMLPLILIFVGLFRCAAGLWGFSGMATLHGLLVNPRRIVSNFQCKTSFHTIRRGLEIVSIYQCKALFHDTGGLLDEPLLSRSRICSHGMLADLRRTFQIYNARLPSITYWRPPMLHCSLHAK